MLYLEIHKHLSTPEKEPSADESNGSTQVQLDEPMSLLGLLTEICVKDYVQDGK